MHRRITISVLTAVACLSVASPAVAASPPVSDPHIVAHFDFASGQTPESLALEPDGSVDESFAYANQIARVSPKGKVSVLAQLPFSPNTTCAYGGGAGTALGLDRDSKGTLYAALCTGNADLQGIWRITPDGKQTRLAALSPAGFPNGVALDRRQKYLYVADSLLSTVWRVSVADGSVKAWVTGPELAPDGFLGANGIKVHAGAVYVSDTQHGTFLRIPIQPDGSAGSIQTVASGLNRIDDFAFTGPEPGADAVAALNFANQVVVIHPDGSNKVVLTAADGLSNPSSIAIRNRTLYVNDSAYGTQTDPNLLLACLTH